jgi:PEGA domain
VAITIAGGSIAALALAPGIGHAQPTADARAQAAAAFRRAAAAEGKKDWRTAIAEYQAAYQLSPHPDVLYNLAAVYEHVGEWRSAASNYRGYLDGNREADDRTKVEARIAELQTKPGALTITTSPPGGRITVDGRARGPGPVVLEVAAGSHNIVADDGGTRVARAVTMEYGEPQSIELVMVVGRGTLVVTSNVAGASVQVDGQAVGRAPWNGTVDAGPHTVVVAAAGYTTVERSVTVSADGTAQIQGSLGRPLGYVDPAPIDVGGSVFSIDSGARLPTGPIVELTYGYRSPSLRFEGLTGFSFSTPGFGWAIRARAFLATGRIRPYLVAGLAYGLTATPGISGGFVGGGVMIATATTGRVRYDLFVESGYGVGPDANRDNHAFVPIVGGLTFHAVRSQP